MQALEVGGEAAYRGIVSQYRRSLVWVDVDEQNSYLVDVFRVAGGAQHDYSVHVPAGQAEQVLLANCIPPFGKPRQSALRYLFLRNGNVPSLKQQTAEHASADLRSTFVTVMEPLSREPFIRRVRRLDSGTGLGESGVGLVVERTDGATDLVVCLEDAGSVEVDDLSMQGRIGLCTIDEEAGTPRLALLDGTSLSRGEASIACAGQGAGKVVSVDYDAMTVVVREQLPPGDALAGRKIIFSTPPRTACFTVDSVEPVREGSRIKLRELDAIACYSKVEGADKGTVTLNSAISIYHSGTALAGMRLYNEDRSVGVRIKRFDRRWDPNSPWPPFGGTAHVEGGHDLQRAFADHDGDGKVMAWVYEFGPGDRYRLVRGAYLARAR